MVSETDMLGAVGQLGELVPGGHGKIIDAVEAANEEITGGRFGNTASSRRLRRPAKAWMMNPFGSSEKRKPFGNPDTLLVIVARPGITIVTGTAVPVLVALKRLELCSFRCRRYAMPNPNQRRG